MSHSEADLRCARKIANVVPRTMRVIRKEMRAHRADLTVPQFRLLALLRHGPVTNRAASEWLGVTAPTASRLLDTLERKGLVRRSVSNTDAREISARLTLKGSTRLAGIHRAVEAGFAPRLASLTAVQRRELFEGLEILAAIFREDEA